MNWKSIVSAVAPVLGTALGGPFGGMATKAVANAVLGTGVTDNTPPQEWGQAIESVLATDSEALARLKEADHAFDAEMKRLDVDIMKIDADDRSSARQMAANTSLKPQIIQAVLWDMAFLGLLWVVFAGDVTLDGVQGDIAKYLLGILSAGMLQINNFFFGSSAGSKQKTDKLGAKG